MLEKRKKKICVAISCFNQEDYIGECVRNLLAQQISGFDIEILICDDASMDRTKFTIQQIIRDFGLKKGWSVRDCSNEKNMGMPENTKRIIRLLMDSGADYGCILEGDDYWISPFWLEEHIKCMEEDDSISMTNNILLIYNQNDNVYVVRQYPEEVQKSGFILAKMQAEDNYTGNFSSNMYRISAMKKITEDFLSQPYVDDWFVNLLMSEQGKVMQIKQPMSVYRVHNKSVWNGRARKKKNSNGEESSILKRIRFMHYHYPGKYLAELANFSERWANFPMMGKVYFASRGGVFKEENSLPVYMLFENGRRFVASIDLHKLPSNVKKLRYDPVEGYRCKIEKLRIKLNHEEIPFKIVNGILEDDKIIFDNTDPMLVLDINKKQLKKLGKLYIDGEIEYW